MNAREKEFLMKKYRDLRVQYEEHNKAFNTNPSIARIEPFRIADGLYYVGDRKVCIHLIDAGEGLILINSGYLGATHLLIDSIFRAGFDPKNVRWILHTHGHSDHFGASDEFRSMYGTRLAISRVDAEMIRQTPHYAHVNGNAFPFAKIPEFDYEIEDGEIFEYGNARIRCVLTPGHTQGVLSLFFPVTDCGVRHMAGLFGGAGVKAITLPYICYNEDPEDCPQQMLQSIERIWDEKVTVHLGNHPYNNYTIEKRERQLREGGNPCVDPDSWHSFLSRLQGQVKNVMADNETIKAEMKAFLNESPK